MNRTQSKLQKMAEEFPFDENHRPNAHVDDSDYYNLSDGEPERPTNGINTQGMVADLARIQLGLVSIIRRGSVLLSAVPCLVLRATACGSGRSFRVQIHGLSIFSA